MILITGVSSGFGEATAALFAQAGARLALSARRGDRLHARGGYSASKWGVVGFSESLRREVYQDNIRVTVIEPGVAQTELRDHIAHAPTRAALNSWADRMRQLQSADIARTIVFCAGQPAHVNINEILMRPTDQER